MPNYSNRNGFVRLKVLFTFLLLFAVIHIAVKLVPMYMDAERMKDAMTVKARLAQNLKDDEILIDLEKEAKELGLPLTQEDFILYRDDDGRRMKVSTEWDVELNFFWGVYVRNFHFAPVISEDYAMHF